MTTANIPAWYTALMTQIELLPEEGQLDFVAEKLGWPLPSKLPRPSVFASFSATDWETFARENGFTVPRETTHQFTYEHPDSGIRIGHAKTPSDARSFANAGQDARRSVRLAAMAGLAMLKSLGHADAESSEADFLGVIKDKLRGITNLSALQDLSKLPAGGNPAETEEKRVACQRLLSLLRKEFDIAPRQAFLLGGESEETAERFAALCRNFDNASSDTASSELSQGGVLLRMTATLQEVLTLQRQRAQIAAAAKEKIRQEREAAEAERAARDALLAQLEFEKRNSPRGKFDTATEEQQKHLARIRSELTVAVQRVVAMVGDTPTVPYPAGVEMELEKANKTIAELTARIQAGEGAQGTINALNVAKAELEAKCEALQRDVEAAQSMLGDASQIVPLKQGLAEMVAAAEAISDKDGVMELISKVSTLRSTAVRVKGLI